MLSYLHGYHAGNHADVLKHTVLTALLARLVTKDKRTRSSEPTGGSLECFHAKDDPFQTIGRDLSPLTPLLLLLAGALALLYRRRLAG